MPKNSFASTWTRDQNRLSAPSYLHNTQLSKKKKKSSKVTSKEQGNQNPKTSTKNIKEYTNNDNKQKNSEKKQISHNNHYINQNINNLNAMSSVQYVSNGLSTCQNNGNYSQNNNPNYYLKNSVREKGNRVRLKKKGANSQSSSNENKSNFLKGLLGQDSSPAQSMFKGTQKRMKNISMF